MDRKTTTLGDHVEALRLAVRETRNRLPFRSDAMVVLPDRHHAVV